MGNIKIIAAIGKNRELGYNNELIWHIKEDLKFFKETTEYHTVVMGRKTFESLPNLLSNRNHIVLSTHDEQFPDSVVVCHSYDELNNLLEVINGEIFIIGGESIYRLFIDSADEMILTEIDDEKSDADAFFPKIDSNKWDSEIIYESEYISPSYLRKVYKRKN